MRDFRHTERELDAALDERAPAGDPLAGFVGEVRDAFGGAPDESTARAHIAAMLAAASEPAVVVPLEKRVLSARKRALRLAGFAAAAMFAVSGISTGLAFAGVIQMPEPARQVLSHLGINLPAPAGKKPHPSTPATPPSVAPSHPAPQGSGGRPENPGSQGRGHGDHGNGSGGDHRGGDQPGTTGVGGDHGSGDHGDGGGDHRTTPTPTPTATSTHSGDGGDGGDGRGGGSGRDGGDGSGTPTPSPDQTGD